MAALQALSCYICDQYFPSSVWWADAATLSASTLVCRFWHLIACAVRPKRNLQAFDAALSGQYWTFKTVSQAHGYSSRKKIRACELCEMFFSCVLRVCGRRNNPDRVWGADSRKMYVMSPCFSTVVYPASITDKHKAPRALIWACHKQPAAPALQCFTNRCGGHISIQPDLFYWLSHKLLVLLFSSLLLLSKLLTLLLPFYEWVYKYVLSA